MSVPVSEKRIELSDAIEHGLTEQEFEKIKDYLGRNPTVTELGVYSGLWSEHCSYKNSILQLKTLPSDSPRAVARAGEENAGVLDIGDGLAVVFKIESHNHPTAIEPYQGAATGVGGIMRDIFTMGARPICSLNSLRFGPLDQPRNRYLFERAVKGIGDYGNCLGVAVSGGEIFFDPSYSRNCLVNAMTVGVVEKHRIARSASGGPGNPVFYVGATTGRDGIHGASFASQDLSEESESRRSAVQVGDPFMEKLLLEATLELTATDALVGIQDMGAAGLSCSSAEMSAAGNVGMDLNLDLIPLREEGMNAYEIMLSESQERMLAVVKKGRENEIISIFEKWGLHACQVGEVIEGDRLRIFQHGQLQADMPANSLVLGGGAPRYEREQKRPDYLDEVRKFKDSDLPESTDLATDFLKLVNSANVGSRRPVYEQYDTEVGLVKIAGPGGHGGLARIPETRKGLAVATDCNSRYVYLDPHQGTVQAVAEAARNVAVTGAVPIGVTNCLNFGNPYIPENYYVFASSIAGMGEACRHFEIPVTGGNVSFYNESEEGPVLPTPMIGIVGLIENIENAIGSFFEPGLSIYLVGEFRPSFGGSEYLYLQSEKITGQVPDCDLDLEKRLHSFLAASAESKLLYSAADTGLGGLAVSLFRSAYNPHSRKCTGFTLDQKVLDSIHSNTERKDKTYFGETNGTLIVSVKNEQEGRLRSEAERFLLPVKKLGQTNTGDLDFADFVIKPDQAIAMYESSLLPETE